MKKNIMIVAAFASLLALSGCTQQVASVGPDDGTTMVASDTVTLDGSSSQDINGAGSNGAYGANGANAQGSNGKNSVHFAYDSNKLSQREKNKIAQDASTLRRKQVVKVEGNSDEFGTDEYNYALGLRRAKAVKDNMVARGVSAEKIKVVSYGESNPLCADGTKSCYQKNRRADYN